jgi:predicted ArsR family transcriptional regulator
MSQLDKIMDLLKERGPMTVREIGAELYMTQKVVTFHIGMFRKYRKGIRIHSFDMSGRTRKERRYELGDADDAKFPHGHRAPSQINKKRHPKKTLEEVNELAHSARLRELSEKTKPFRDPLLFMTAGVAP